MKVKANKLATFIVKTYHKVKFKAAKRSPEILLITAGFGAVGSGVGACFATKKTCDVLAVSNADNEVLEIRASEATDAAVREEMQQAIKKNKTMTRLKVVSYYLPPVTGMALSLLAGYGSHHVLSKRYVGAVAYAATINEAFEQYRKRVVENFGEEADKKLFYNAGFNDVEEEVLNEDGTTEKISTKVGYSESENFPGYTVIFDAGNPNGRNGFDYSKMFVRCVENWAEIQLQTNGYLFLSDVLDQLGYDRKKKKELYRVAQVVGWWLDDEKSDGHVDFQALDMIRPTDDPDNPYEKYILLNFNVDGNIWEKM